MMPMSTFLEMGKSVAEQAVALGVYSIGQGLVLTLLVALLLRFCRGLNAATRYAIWVVTLVVVCLLPLLQGVESVRGEVPEGPVQSAVYLSNGLAVPEFAWPPNEGATVLQVEPLGAAQG